MQKKEEDDSGGWRSQGTKPIPENLAGIPGSQVSVFQFVPQGGLPAAH